MEKNRYIVMTACAKMPTKCWGKYRRVAVVEVEAGFPGRPYCISEHARGVVSVVWTWEKCNVGISDRCAYGRALRAATEMAARLNGVQ
jgi:hypothetical protein